MYGKTLKIGDGTNKTYFLVMATWDNNEIDDGKVASIRKTGNSSDEESADTDGGYYSDKYGASGHRNWKELKSKQAGGLTGGRLLEDNLSNGEVGEDEQFDKVRKRMHKKNRKTDEHKNEIEATNQRISPEKESTEGSVSPPRRSGRSRK